jgi:hypothetical protein
MKWKTYWLYLGTNVLQSVLLPVGATDQQVRYKAMDDLEIMPAIAYPSAPFEHRTKIMFANIIEDDHEFERTTPKEFWGYVPTGLLDDPPNQPESPWVTRQREAYAAQERVIAKRRRRLAERNSPTEDLGPAI